MWGKYIRGNCAYHISLGEKDLVLNQKDPGSAQTDLTKVFCSFVRSSSGYMRSSIIYAELGTWNRVAGLLIDNSPPSRNLTALGTRKDSYLLAYLCL